MQKKMQSSFQRYEKKYLLTSEQQAVFLESMRQYMEPDVYGQTTNCSIYYDTDSWELIRKSIEKPVYKEKLRLRSYGVPKTGDTVFAEIKKKYDDVVYKRRIAMEVNSAESFLAGEASGPESQIAKEITWFQQRYQAKPKVFIAYDRTSYAGTEEPELRITFDRNIRFRENNLNLQKGDYGETMLPDGTVLMEIKIPGTAPLWLAQLLSELKIRPTSFSKYGHYYKNYVLQNNKENHTNVYIYHPKHNHFAGLSVLHNGIGRSGIA